VITVSIAAQHDWSVSYNYDKYNYNRIDVIENEREEEEEDVFQAKTRAEVT
jgi:hypothetical protein